MKCNFDCFNCIHDDCIATGHDILYGNGEEQKPKVEKVLTKEQERQKRYYQKNRERLLQKANDYYANHREELTGKRNKSKNGNEV